MKQEELLAQPTGKYIQSIYYFTVIIYFISAIPCFAMFIYYQKPWPYFFLVFLVQLVPPFEYFIIKKNKYFLGLDPYICTFSTVIYGFFWGSLGYSTLFGGSLFLMLLTCFVTDKGPSCILKVIFSFLLGAYIGGYLEGFSFNPELHTTMLCTLAATLFIFLTVYAIAMNGNFVYLRKIRRELAIQKNNVDRINKIIVEASGTFSIEKIIQVILKAINENNNFNYGGLITLDKSNNRYSIFGPYSYESYTGSEINFKTIQFFLEENHVTLFNSFAEEGLVLFRQDTGDSYLINIKELMAKQWVFNSILSIPLIQKNIVIGVIFLFSSQLEKDIILREKNYINKFITQLSAIISNNLLHIKAEEQKIIMENKQVTYEKISKELSVYLSPQIYKHIFTKGNNVNISSQRKYLTIFLSELVGYTKALKTLDHEKSINLLNDYLGQMYDIALEHGATIDKYMGDNMLIFFGDPETEGMEKDAIRCVTMALAMRHRVDLLQEKWHELGIKDLSLRAGINSGYCNVGNFGSHHHVEYTLIGNGVNLASRIQQIANPSEILIGESTFLLIQSTYHCEEKGEFRAKGVRDAFNVYHVIEPTSDAKDEGL